jgi:hypothetical protein
MEATRNKEQSQDDSALGRACSVFILVNMSL